MPFTGPMEDRLAIRELYDTNADGACRGDKATWLGTFAEDARWKTHYFELTGHEAIGATFDEINAEVENTTFFIQVCSIEIDGDTAHARVEQNESLLYRDGRTYDLVGLYEDELVRRDGAWRFRDRNYLVMREKQPGEPTV
jgi:uncharacterized protein (TIGR02246 family)